MPTSPPRSATRALALAFALGGLVGACDDGGETFVCEPDPCPRLHRCDAALQRCVADENIDGSLASASPSLARTSDGIVYVAAHAESVGDLLFGVWDPVESRVRWSTVASQGDVGAGASISLFPDQRPAIAHVDSTRDQLAFTFLDADDDVWRTEIVDQTRVTGVDLHIDADGVPHLAYRDENAGILRYAFRPDRVWQIENVDLANDVGRVPDAELCPTEQRRAVRRGVGFDAHVAVQESTPVISYYDADCGTLRVARRGGAQQWTLRVLDGWSRADFDANGPDDEPATRVGRFNDIAVDELGRFVVVYFDATVGQLRSVDLAGVQELVDDGLRTDDQGRRAQRIVGQMPAIAVRSSGDNVVAHLDATTRDVLISRRQGGGWSTLVLDDAPGGFSPDVVTDADGNLYIAGVRRDGGASVVEVRTLPLDGGEP